MNLIFIFVLEDHEEIGVADNCSCLSAQLIAVGGLMSQLVGITMDFGAKLQETDKPSSDCLIPAQNLSDGCSGGNKVGSGNEFIEEPLKRIWRSSDLDSMLDEKENVYEYENHPGKFKNAKIHITRVLEVLQQDGPGFDTKAALDELHIEVSGLLVREVLFKILKPTNYVSKTDCEEFKAMWRLVDEMIEKDYPTTA
ncbi:Pentatricopeptide repeat superfamily protein [Prunus dulcis]|uniref:Pentatricopeptide repeat superfamily protein n=1 Tax=Prunus dulcis TaxID=3755 RepID=A0A4Y1QYM0_PRUDU|nr:Pentatricopeptide repeat superfamily protein [Prunus dulcis]